MKEDMLTLSKSENSFAPTKRKKLDPMLDAIDCFVIYQKSKGNYRFTGNLVQLMMDKWNEWYPLALRFQNNQP